MRDRFPLLLIGFVLLVGGAGTTVLQGAARGSFADVLSTYRSEADGSRGLYLLLEGAQVPVTRTQSSLDIVDEATTPVLLGVDFREAHARKVGIFGLQLDGGFQGPDDDDEPSADEDPEQDVQHRGANAVLAQAATPKERERLLDHVREGGTLVYVPWGHRDHALLQALQVELWRADPALGMRTLVPAQPAPHVAGVEKVEAKVQAFLGLPPGAVPLLVDDRLGEAVAGLVRYGQGTAIVIGAPELAMNKALARADNALFWRSLARAASKTGKLAFDEHHHGFDDERSVADFAARYGLQFAIAQLVLGVCLWAAALRRFGRPQPPHEEARVGGTDVLLATSRLYREGRHGAHAAQTIVRELCAELAPVAGARARATPGEVSTALARRARPELAQLLDRVTALAADADSDREVLEVAKEAAHLRRLAHAKRLSKANGATHAAPPVTPPKGAVS